MLIVMYVLMTMMKKNRVNEHHLGGFYCYTIIQSINKTKRITLTFQ